MPFPPDIAELPISSWGRLRHQPIRQLVSVSLSSSSEQLSVYSHSQPTGSRKFGTERVTFSKEIELTQRCWVLPRLGEGEGQSAERGQGVQGVADSFVADDRPHCPLSLQERRLGDTVSSGWKTDSKRYQ